MNTRSAPEQSRDPTDDDDERPVVSSHRQHLLDMCARKEKFATWHHAEAAAKRINRHKRTDDRYVAPFVCPCCQGCHVGSRPKRINKKGYRP